MRPIDTNTKEGLAEFERAKAGTASALAGVGTGSRSEWRTAAIHDAGEGVAGTGGDV